MIDDRRKKRIADLLGLAGEEPRTPEQSLAWDRAQKLCERYGVTVASMRDYRAASLAADGVVQTWYDVGNRSLWRSALAWEIAPYTNVQIIRFGPKLSIIGTAGDVDHWRALYERAMREIDDEARSYLSNLPSGYVHRKSEGDTFRKGAAFGFGEKLKMYKAEAEASVNGQTAIRAIAEASGGRESTALVLIGRALAVQQKKQAIHPDTTPQKMAIRGSRDSFRDGHRFGRSMGVHRGEIE